MDKLKLFFSKRYEKNPKVRGLIFIDNTSPEPTFETFDYILLVVSDQMNEHDTLSHYIKDNRHIQERWIKRSAIDKQISRSLINWIMNGEIILDNDGFLTTIRRHNVHLSDDLKERKLFIEFSLLLDHFLQSKIYFASNHILDAYSEVLDSLHHWGRMAVIENGQRPELTVWKQVRDINPGLSKLYEELTLSQDPLKKRVELVLLACEFSIMEKMESSCRHLFRIMEEKKSWSVNELNQRLADTEISVDISRILSKLARRGFLQTSIQPLGEQLYEIKYSL